MEEFDDFKPASTSLDIKDSGTKKSIEKELSEIELFKEVNDDFLFCSEDPKLALTEMMVEYIQNVGDVNEVNFCSYYSGKGEGIDAWGYSGDEEFMSIDLFLTVLVDPEKSQTLPKSEIERYFKWMEKFFNRSRNSAAKHLGVNEKSDLNQVAQLIHDSDKVDRVRLFLMTNSITPYDLIIDEKESEEGSIIEYHVWDVKRIKKHDDILRGKESVVVDFEDQGFRPLPCIKMPDVSNRVECYLSIIPGETLSKIYNQYHQHILEQNVRTFLQFKGASNKGIRDTLIGHKPTASQKAKGDKPRDPEPDMFFSYNNGISTTATDIEIRDTDQGPVIIKLTDWQIVNGGQTTASISAVMKMKDTDPDMIKKVFVAMKVSVIKSKEEKEDLVPRISQFANTQSAVKKSDFGINEPFLQELEQQSRSVWVKNAQNKEISKWFFERTRGQYMDKAKHTANAREEREYYAEYPKTQMFDKTMLAKSVMAWELDPAMVCKGGENCYSAFYKLMTSNKFHFEEKEFKQTVSKLILFRAIDAFYGKDGIKLAGYKSQMIAYTLATLARISNKAINLLSIWDEQCVVSPSLYKDLEGKLLPIYVKLATGNDVITYKVKLISVVNGKKKASWLTKSVEKSDIQKIKDTTLYKVLVLVKSLYINIWEHISDVDAGVAIDTYCKKSSCWQSMLDRHFESKIAVPSDILSSQEEFEMTPAMMHVVDVANSYEFETWHVLSEWGKSTGNLTPRDSAFLGSIYFWCKRGKELTYKQARYAMKLIEKARAAGWDE